MRSSRLGASLMLAIVATMALSDPVPATSNERATAYVHWETKSRVEAPVPIPELQIA